MIFVGCAGWAIPKAHSALFPEKGTHLERYAGRFNAVEINSSFYRSHQHETYLRWSLSVPVSFRFAVKMPKEITHTRRLRDAGEPLERFLAEIAGLGPKLGMVLVQLPPSLRYESKVVRAFLTSLRALHSGPIAFEPRHASWFTAEVARVLEGCRVTRVAADPAPVPLAAVPGGSPEFCYYRLHGSPHRYYSAYADGYLETLAASFREAASGVWCIFDNTAALAAVPNGLRLLELLEARGPASNLTRPCEVPDANRERYFS